ncbi:MAG: nuclear transport factor 2 family protein [Pseudomonadota bacterium]
MSDGIALATKFFTATAAADLEALEALCTEDFQGQQNGGPAMDRKALLRFTAVVHRAVVNFRYENIVSSNTGTGFVEEHDVVCDLADGPFRLPVCVVAETRGEQITAMREYLDGAGAARLLAALASA